MSESFNEGLGYLAFHIAKAMAMVFERDSYLYWPYVVSSIVLAAVAWRWLAAPHPRRTWDAFLDEYFSRKLWWHPSARADYWLYLANALVVPGMFAFLLLDSREVASAISAAAGLDDNATTEASVESRILYTILFFVAYDFGRFVMHCVLHDVPVLWEFHKVHHSAEVLTPMTSFRAHPVELLLMAWGPLVTTGALTVAFNALSSSRLSFYSFLGVHVLLFVSNLIGNLRHSPVWLSYGPGVGRWLISPAHHQLHHSCELRHIGCNRGFELAIWDRIYGTLYVPNMQPEQFKVGLGDNTEPRYHRLSGMYWLPFVGAATRLTEALRRSIAKAGVR